MNKKGQVLVMFVLLLPLLIIALTFIFNLSTIYINKTHSSNILKKTINYALLNNDIESIDDLLYKNISNIKNIEINKNDYLKVSLTYQNNSILKNIFKDKYDIKIEYKGYIKNNEIYIERVK